MSKILFHENLRTGGAADYTFGIIQFYDTPPSAAEIIQTVYRLHSAGIGQPAQKARVFNTIFLRCNGEKLLKFP